MPLVINGEPIPEELIERELELLAKLPAYQNQPAQIWNMAESAVIHKTILRQIAEVDARPLDPAEVEREVQCYRSESGCGAQINDDAIRANIESQLRVARTRREMVGDAPMPSPEDVQAFYHANKHHFRTTQTAHAAHIVVNVDDQRSEADARGIIELAARELADGVPFAEAAERHSDCKGKGGELDPFSRGDMVDEFEEAVFQLEPGARSGIFRTPFGFHIAELRAKSEAEPCALGVVGPDIQAFLTARAEQERMGRALQYLLANSRIERVAAGA